MDTRMTHVCAAECAQILDDTGKMFVECIKDTQSGVMHVYVYAQQQIRIIPHLKGELIESKCGDDELVLEQPSDDSRDIYPGAGHKRCD